VEKSGENRVGDSIESEYIGIANYCIIALIQLQLNGDSEFEMEKSKVMRHFDERVAVCKELMLKKNHDYGEAWQDLRISTFTDLILMKILRIRKIEDKSGQTLISEGIDANYSDMLNYAIFAIIRINNFFKE
jgi:hypothetical protein